MSEQKKQLSRLPREINSLELYEILSREPRNEGEPPKFQHVQVYAVRLPDGRQYIVNDDLPTTCRKRSYEELSKLHLTDEEWQEFEKDSTQKEEPK